jgi:hypothetical protein
MAWRIANTDEMYDGPTHFLAGVTYSGKTRTAESRRLVFVSEPKVEPKKRGRPRKVRNVSKQSQSK